MKKLATLTGAAVLVLGFASAALAVPKVVIIGCQKTDGFYDVKHAQNSVFGPDFLAHLQGIHGTTDNCADVLANVGAKSGTLIDVFVVGDGNRITYTFVFTN